MREGMRSPSSPLFFIQEEMKNMKTCDYRPLLLSNRLPKMYLNNPKSDFDLFTFLLNEQSLTPLFLSRTHGDTFAMFTATGRRRVVNKVREVSLAGSRTQAKKKDCVFLVVV